MLVINKAVKLNDSDTVAFTSNMAVEALASYSNNTWEVIATVSASGNIGSSPIEATKRYTMPASLLIEMDKGEGKFASMLGLIVESYVAEDLRQINPGAEILVQL